MLFPLKFIDSSSYSIFIGVNFLSLDCYSGSLVLLFFWKLLLQRFVRLSILFLLAISESFKVEALIYIDVPIVEG